MALRPPWPRLAPRRDVRRRPGRPLSARRAPAVLPTLDLEAQFLSGGAHRLVAGMDEVGRGALAGPVSVGVALVGPEHVADGAAPAPVGLADSKLLRPTARDGLVDPVRAWVRGAAVGHASPGEIDAHGIVGALRLAGMRALGELSAAGLTPDLVLLDGTHDWLTAPAPQLDLGGAIGTDGIFDPTFTGPGCPPVHTVRKGDATCTSIAAASVLAKVERDALMVALDDPGYGFAGHKGYGAPTHLDALRQLGPGEHHRRSWKLPARAGAPGEGMMER